MQRFLKKFFLVSALPLVLFFVFDMWLRNLTTSYSEKYDGLIEQKDSVEVLFLGNSHANYGIDPTAFSKYYAYNLANVNQVIYYDKRLTMKAIDEGVTNLKYVFISTDYHSLYNWRQGQREIWSYYGNGIKHEERNYFLPNLSPLFFGYTPHVAYSLLRKNIKNGIKYKGVQITEFEVERGVNITDTLKQGFLGYTGNSTRGLSPSFYPKRAQYFEEPEDSPRDEVILDLKDFIAQLQAKGIEPILLAYPTYTEYNQFLDSTIIKRNAHDIAAISEEFDIQYWNYMDSEEFEKEVFYDCDHLNKQGAKVFSKILSDRLDRYENRSRGK